MRGLRPVDLASSTPHERDRIEETLASYRAMHRPEEALPVLEIGANETEETFPSAASLRIGPTPIFPEDLEAIALYMDGYADTIIETTRELDSAESSGRIALALSANQVSYLLTLDFPAETCAGKLEAMRQGREMGCRPRSASRARLQPVPERFIGILRRDDKALLDAILSAPSPLSTPHANSSVDLARKGEELERADR